MKNINIVYLFVLIVVLTATYACKKNIETAKEEPAAAAPPATHSTYLKLADFAAFKNLLYSVGGMTDAEYSEWKKVHNLNTLYDRFIEVEKQLLAGGNAYQVTDKDSVFFSLKNSHLDSKNGILADKVLNREALIQIGDKVYKLTNQVITPQEDISVKGKQESALPNVSKQAGNDKAIQQAAYVAYINPAIQAKSLRRSLVDFAVKKIKLIKDDGSSDILEVQYTFYIQPIIEKK